MPLEPTPAWCRRRVKKMKARERQRGAPGAPRCERVTADDLFRVARATPRCTACGVELVYGTPAVGRKMDPSAATVDRVDVLTPCYTGNWRILCLGCNERKGGWDLAQQLKARIRALEAGNAALRGRLLRGGSSRRPARRRPEDAAVRRGVNRAVAASTARP